MRCANAAQVIIDYADDKMHLQIGSVHPSRLFTKAPASATGEAKVPVPSLRHCNAARPISHSPRGFSPTTSRRFEVYQIT